MRKLAGASRQIPGSYPICTFSRCRVEKTVIVGSGFADIRKGRFKGMDVAVKTLRTSQKSRTWVQYTRYGKPSDILSLTVNQHEIPNPGLLQGVRSLDEYVPP